MDDAIINGTATTLRVGVGKLVVGGLSCTATLISSRVILTASHCIGDISKSGLGDASNQPTFPTTTNGTFTMFAAAGAIPSSMSRSVRRIAMLQNGYGDKDLAVAELDSDVPSSWAPPLEVATTEPAEDELMTAYGYGCTAGDGRSGMWINVVNPPANTKTSVTSRWNRATHTTKTNVICAGDSGGPTLNAAGQIVAVHSSGAGQLGVAGSDGNGHAWEWYRWIDQLNAIYGNRQRCKYCTTIALRTADNVHFLQATNGGGFSVTAATTNRLTWETFRVVNLAANGATTPWLALQASNDQWVSVGGGGSSLLANRSLIGTSEVLRAPAPWALQALSGQDSTSTTLRSILAAPAYACAENGGGSTVNVNRINAESCTKFTAFAN